MFGRIAVQIVDIERAVASREIAGRKSVGPAPRPAAAIAVGALLARVAQIPSDSRTVTPAFRLRPPDCAPLASANTVGRRNPARDRSGNPAAGAAFAGALPFMGVAIAFAHGPADLRGLARFHPDHGIRAGNIRKFELIDADLRVFRPLRRRIIERRQILAPADLLKPGILVVNARPIELRLASSGVTGCLLSPDSPGRYSPDFANILRTALICSSDIPEPASAAATNLDSGPARTGLRTRGARNAISRR